MARIRSIKPEFWTDPDLAALPIEARLFFIGVWNHADDYGVLKDDPARLKLQILPADDVDPAALVDHLIASGHLLRRVAPDGTAVLVVRTFEAHQKIDRRAVGRWGHPSEFTHPIPTNPAASPPKPPDPHLGLEGKGLEGTGENTPPTLLPAQPAQPTAPPPPAAEALMPTQFDAFWALWPASRRVKKPDARKAWAKAIRAGAVDVDIFRGVKAWAAHWQAAGTEDQFIPHPATWLNAQQWKDPTPRPTRPSSRSVANAAARDALLGGPRRALEAG